MQSFPVRLYREGKSIGGFIGISPKELVVMQQCTHSHFFTVDIVQMKQVMSLMKSKNHPTKILIEVRRKSRNYGLEISSDEYDTIMGTVVEQVRAEMKSHKSIDLSD